MTKDEAVTAIGKAIGLTVVWQSTGEAIRKILDQIDPPQQEFSVRELCELLRPGNYVSAWPEETFTIWPDKVMAGDIDDLKAKLTELATPPKPKTVMVELPMEMVAAYASLTECSMTPDMATLHDAATAALNKLEQQQAK